MHEYRRIHYAARPPGLLARIATAVVAGGALVASFFLGLAMLAVFAGLALIVGIVVAVRVWFFRREVERHLNAQRPPDEPRRPGSGHIIQGEFTEVNPRDGDPGRRD